MDTLPSTSSSPRRFFVLTMLLLAVGAASVSCQVGKWGTLSQTASKATVASTPSASVSPTITSTAAVSLDSTLPPMEPTATPAAAPESVPPAAPAPAGTPVAPTNELDAASQVISIPTVSLPKGARKSVPTRLMIPSIGVDTKVIELGTHYNSSGQLVWDTAPFAAGHHIGTANPGEPGNVVISGHISSLYEGDVFKRLPEINVGDGVVIETSDQDYVYQVVEKKVVEPTQIDVINSTGVQEVTLITCVPDGVYTQRLIVTAKRI